MTLDLSQLSINDIYSIACVIGLFRAWYFCGKRGGQAIVMRDIGLLLIGFIIVALVNPSGTNLPPDVITALGGTPRGAP